MAWLHALISELDGATSPPRSAHLNPRTDWMAQSQSGLSAKNKNPHSCRKANPGLPGRTQSHWWLNLTAVQSCVTKHETRNSYHHPTGICPKLFCCLGSSGGREGAKERGNFVFKSWYSFWRKYPGLGLKWISCSLYDSDDECKYEKTG
jgi:hypothetical protein